MNKVPRGRPIYGFLTARRLLLYGRITPCIGRKSVNYTFRNGAQMKGRALDELSGWLEIEDINQLLIEENKNENQA